MELSNEQFQQLSGCDSTPPTSGSDDRRKGIRVIFGKRGKIRPLFGSAPDGGKTALLRDVSVSGVGFLVADAMEVGDEFLLRSPIDTGGHLYIHCIVRRCEAGGTGGKQFIVGASFEQVLDPSTLTDEQTADHHERIEVTAAQRAVDDANDPSEAAGGLKARGLFGSLRSAIEARQAAKLRRRLRTNGSLAEEADEASIDESPAFQSMPAQSEDSSFDSVLSVAPVAATGVPVPTVVNENRRSLFSKTADPAPTPAAKPEESKPVAAAPQSKELSANELASIIASNYGTSVPSAEKASASSAALEAALQSPVAIEPAATEIIPEPTATESLAKVDEPAPQPEPVRVEQATIPEVVVTPEPMLPAAPAIEAMTETPVEATPIAPAASKPTAPVETPVTLPPIHVPAVASEVVIPKAYASRNTPVGVVGVDSKLVIPSARPQSTTAPAQKAAHTHAAPAVEKNTMETEQKPEPVAKPAVDASPAPTAEPSPPPVVSAAASLSKSLQSPSPFPRKHETTLHTAKSAADRAEDEEPAVATPKRAASTPRVAQRSHGNTKPIVAMDSCEIVLQTPTAYSPETLEGYAQATSVDVQDGPEEPKAPKSVYFPPELDGPHPAIRGASAETLLRDAAARSRHSRRRGKTPARR